VHTLLIHQPRRQAMPRHATLRASAVRDRERRPVQRRGERLRVPIGKSTRPACRRTWLSMESTFSAWRPLVPRIAGSLTAPFISDVRGVVAGRGVAFAARTSCWRPRRLHLSGGHRWLIATIRRRP
jgi:hypothetical protein